MSADLLHDFITAATVSGNHKSGSLDRARELLAQHPDLPKRHVAAAAVTGDEPALAALLSSDVSAATTRTGPRDWVPLLYLTFSLFLRDDPERRAAFRACARRLLDAGADPNAYWIDPPEEHHGRETALYGACGIAYDAPLTQMLLEAGADPNDGESPYHSVETDDLSCALLLFDHGLNADSGAMALLHRLDWDDLAGMERLIDAGADPNHTQPYGKAALHQSLQRSRTLPFFERLLAHGADPDGRMHGGVSAYALAARLGRTDVVALFEQHGADTRLDPVSAFIAACARGDDAEVRRQLAEDPGFLKRLDPHDLQSIVFAASDGNTTAVRGMLDAGFAIETVGPWGGTLIHHAAWHGHADTTALLAARGAQLETLNQYGGTPLDAAVWAVGHSGFDRDYLPVIRVLLEAGANVQAVTPFPSGHPEVDALLREFGR